MEGCGKLNGPACADTQFVGEKQCGLILNEGLGDGTLQRFLALDLSSWDDNYLNALILATKDCKCGGKINDKIRAEQQRRQNAAKP